MNRDLVTMPYSTKERSKQYTSDVGTVFNVSVPFHEKHLLDDMDALQHLEMCNSRSQLIRKWVRKEKEANKEQLELMKSYRR